MSGSHSADGYMYENASAKCYRDSSIKADFYTERALRGGTFGLLIKVAASPGANEQPQP